MIDPQQKCRQLLNDARAMVSSLPTAGQSEVCAGFHHEIKIVYENNAVSLVSSGATDQFGLRYIENGKPGFYTLNTADPQARKIAVEEVRVLSKLAPSNAHECIAAEEDFTERRTQNGQARKLDDAYFYERVDSELLNCSPEIALHLMDTWIGMCRTDARIRMDRAAVTIALNCHALVNSWGVQVAAAGTSANWYAMGMARDGEMVTSFDTDGGISTRLTDVEAQMQTSAERFSSGLLTSLHPTGGRSYRGPVLLHPRSAFHLLVAVTAANCNGRRHQDGMSTWREQEGELVAHPTLTIRSNPLDETRPSGWRPFDREGVPTLRTDLIQAGRLKGVAHNCFTAHRAGCRSTGHASGGPRSLPDVGFSAIDLICESTSGVDLLSDRELEARLESGLVMKRFSGNLDPVSGQFSGVAKNSWLVQSGERGPAVHEVMVAGDLFTILREIRSAGVTAHTLASGSRAPYVLVDGLSVTAA
ncbi:MAG: hypothetical protein KDK30_02410 [Leptospiraceae bacterium]|nr:hypothetical protein [Leptospiraceae bacterium]